MSEEYYFCAYCGYESRNKERCTHCGREIDDLYETPPLFSPPLWGRMILRLHQSNHREQIWSELAKIWREQVEEKRPHKPSQLEKFHAGANTVELYGSDDMADLMKETLGQRGSVDFQELPHEQMPQRPESKRLRPPTVPRNKR